jgi:MerR family transcriptional regulator, mercuric resistance operon regulatory protein
MAESMTIGQLAKAAGVNVETVRYYQRRGLLKVPHKPPGGRRAYAREILEQLAFIRRAQSLGFSLEEIKSLLRLAEGTQRSLSLRIAQERRDALAARIAELVAMRSALDGLIRKCKATRAGPCPLITALRGHGRSVALAIRR